MIERLIKPTHRGDLAYCAVVFPLYAGLTLLVPLLSYGLFTQSLSPTASGWTRGLPFWLWMTWVLIEWVRLVAVIRAEPARSNSVRGFHVIQAVAIVFFCLHLVARANVDRAQFFSIWIISVDVAMIAFFVSYFLLALWTWTRPSWHALSGFVLVIASLAYEVWSATRPSHH